MEPIKVESWCEYIFEHRKFTGCLIDHRNNKAYFKNGRCHKEDGPAVEYSNGVKTWYVNGKEYSEQEWLITMRKIKLEKVLKNING